MANGAHINPIDGNVVQELSSLLQDAFASGPGCAGNIKGLDIAMLMNVPPGRIFAFKRALPGGAHTETQEGDGQRVMKPSQAILARLLLRYPHYAPLTPLPDPAYVWEQVQPLVPEWLHGRNRKKARSIMFAPLFGRSYSSSYKFLSGGRNGVEFEPPTNVLRLFMLVLEKLGQVFRSSLIDYLGEHTPEIVQDNAQQTMARDWRILTEQDWLINAFVEPGFRDTFRMQVHERKRGWFELFLQVVMDEAASRHLDPYEALTRGNWRNKEPVDPASKRDYPPRQMPITGSDDYVFDKIRYQMVSTGIGGDDKLTSAEFFWLIGVPIKAYYGFSDYPNHRIDAATSILARYLYRYTSDVSLLLRPPGTAGYILESIRSVDPSFRVAALSPLFGGSYVSSFEFQRTEHCPYDLRRLTSIFTHEFHYNPEIYWQIRQCAEEEAYARGIDSKTFWHELSWLSREAAG